VFGNDARRGVSRRHCAIYGVCVLAHKSAWALAFVVLVAPGCGSKRESDRVHSPSQVADVFAAHGLALYAPDWNLPGRASVDVVGLAADAQNATLIEDPSDLHHLQLALTIWWNDAAAANYASRTKRAAREAKFLSKLSPQSRALFATPDAGKRYERTIRVDNVVADYIDSRYTATRAARLRETIKALAKAPTIKPPCLNNACAE